MTESQQDYPIKMCADIRITGLNRDKTRRKNGSDSLYQVYFELSRAPEQAWRTIFDREWKSMGSVRPHVSLDVQINNKFLAVQCPLQEIVDMYLPALKESVDTTNKLFIKYTHDAATEQQHRTDIWIQERKDVDSMANGLKFE